MEVVSGNQKQKSDAISGNQRVISGNQKPKSASLKLKSEMVSLANDSFSANSGSRGAFFFDDLGVENDETPAANDVNSIYRVSTVQWRR